MLGRVCVKTELERTRNRKRAVLTFFCALLRTLCTCSLRISLADILSYYKRAASGRSVNFGMVRSYTLVRATRIKGWLQPGPFAFGPLRSFVPLSLTPFASVPRAATHASGVGRAFSEAALIFPRRHCFGQVA